MRMHAALVLVATLGIHGCSSDGDIVISELVVSVGAGARRAEVSGCSEANGEFDRRAFVVGSPISLAYGGYDPECLDYERAWPVLGECLEWSPYPWVTIRSTDTFVLGEDDRGVFGFLSPGESTIVLTVDGDEVERRDVRAVAAASLEAFFVAQPALAADPANGFAGVPAELRSADGLTIVRGGPGPRLFVRALAAGGEALCGRPLLSLAPADGFRLVPDTVHHTSEVPRQNDVFHIVADAAAPPHARLELSSAGMTLAIEVDTIDPSELTELRGRASYLTHSGASHMADITAWAGEREVHGASIEVEVAETSGCGQVALVWPEHGPVPGDTRFIPMSPCGNFSEPTYRVRSVEAPAIAVDLFVPRYTP